jgi:flavin reductase (DIM6/NTAB) family NADH-FMN oxidoreductase RutF
MAGNPSGSSSILHPSSFPDMRQIDPATTHHSDVHRLLLAGVAPRPIALAGTVDAQGRPNLSPFSFFNAFGANPPVVAFSPALRGSDGTPKHTFLNIKETGEFTISVVSYAMVEQISLASSDFAEGVDEFVKSGFTKLPSVKIAPFGVAESPMVMECRLMEHVPLGGGPGSGNLMIGEVVMFHVKESVFDGKYPSADRLDLVARMGGPFYCRASGSAVFELPKPSHVGIGFDRLPDALRHSDILTGNDLAKLAGSVALPDPASIDAAWSELLAADGEGLPDDLSIELRVGDADRALRVIAARVGRGEPIESFRDDLHRVAQLHLRSNQIDRAWIAALAEESARR